MTQGEALAMLKTGANVFLTGEPGSGKTHLVNEFVGWLRASGVLPSITAATGIAATHVGGMTLHSWSGIGVSSSLTRVDVDRIASKEHVAKRIGKAKVLIVEEVSMLSAATFEMADSVCREVRRVDKPFGGLSLVLVGDFFQLPPVFRRSPGEGDRGSLFAFSSPVWKELNPLICYLTEQYRQDDADFLGVLSAIRSGGVEESHRELLMTRRVDSGGPTLETSVPKLFSHNADVDRINAAELEKLSGKTTKFHMGSKGKDSFVEGLKRGCLSPEVLELKEGAAVMFTKNSPQGKFVNGTLGRIAGWSAEGYPVVEVRGPSPDSTGSPQAGSGRPVQRITVEPVEWQLEERGKVRASVSQVPLRLAYAMTVHKSQGMSMDAAAIDLSKAFEYGQGYVALSRVRRLSGVYLTGLNQRALEVHPEILEKDKDFRAASDAAREAFALMPEAEVIGMQKKFVKAMGGAWMNGESPSPSLGTTRKSGSAGLPGRLAETLQAVRDGKSLKQVAKDRGLTESTIVKHLEELAELGKLSRADFAHLVPLDAAEEIHEALAENKDGRLSPVFHALGARHSFETIRLVRLLRR